MPSFAVTAYKETQQRAELEWAGEQVYKKHNWQQDVLCTCPVCLINTKVAIGWVSFLLLVISNIQGVPKVMSPTFGLISQLRTVRFQKFLRERAGIFTPVSYTHLTLPTIYSV